jgi:hypothetical protein
MLTFFVSAKDATVVYLKNDGTGDGMSADSAVGSLDAAYAALDLNKDCTIVVCGEFKVPFKNFAYEGNFSGSVTFTSVYGGVDYRDTADAEYVVKSGYRFFLYGDTAFDDIDVRLKGNYWLFIAQCNDAYFGEGFETAFEGKSWGSIFLYLDLAKIFYSTIVPVTDGMSEMSKFIIYSNVSDYSWDKAYEYAGKELTQDEVPF